MVEPTDVLCEVCRQYFINDKVVLEHRRLRHPEIYRRGCDGKRRFLDEASANTQVAFILMSRPPRSKYPNRSYRCPDCDGWHLTSQPPLH